MTLRQLVPCRDRHAGYPRALVIQEERCTGLGRRDTYLATVHGEATLDAVLFQLGRRTPNADPGPCVVLRRVGLQNYGGGLPLRVGAVNDNDRDSWVEVHDRTRGSGFPRHPLPSPIVGLDLCLRLAEGDWTDSSAEDEPRVLRGVRACSTSRQAQHHAEKQEAHCCTSHSGCYSRGLGQCSGMTPEQVVQNQAVAVTHSFAGLPVSEYTAAYDWY